MITSIGFAAAVTPPASSSALEAVANDANFCRIPTEDDTRPEIAMRRPTRVAARWISHFSQ
jgi:hypothetical protein